MLEPEPKLFMSCPICGFIDEVPTCKVTFCPRHLPKVRARLRTVPEHLSSASLSFRHRKEYEGQLDHGHAVNLVRYATIVECMRVAGEAYSEASYDGVDAHGSYHSAMDALQELLNGMQE